MLSAGVAVHNTHRGERERANSEQFQRERAATYVEEPLPQAPISPPHHPLDSRSPRSPGLIGSLTRKLTSNLTELSGKPWGWNRKPLGGTILRHVDIRYREHVPYVNQVQPAIAH